MSVPDQRSLDHFGSRATKSNALGARDNVTYSVSQLILEVVLTSKQLTSRERLYDEAHNLLRRMTKNVWPHAQCIVNEFVSI